MSRWRAQRRRRWRAWFAALTLIALIVVAGTALLRGRAIANAMLAGLLDRAGIPAQSLDIRVAGFTGMTVGAVALGPAGELSADSVAVDWSFWSLLHRRFAHMSVEGLHMKAALERGSFAIAGLKQDGSSGAGLALPVETLVLKDAHLDLAAPAGTVSAMFDATLSQEDEARIVGKATFDMVVTPGQASPLHLVGEVPALRIGDGELHAADGVLRLPERGWSLSGAIVNARLAGDARSFEISGELADQSKPAAWAPLIVALTARGGEAGLALSGTAKSRDNALVLTLAGQHDFASGNGTLAIRSNPVSFARDGRQPADLAPIAGDALKHVDGTLSASGTVSWGSDRALATALDVTLDGVGFDAGSAAVDGLRGSITFDSLAPPRMPSAQCLSASLQIAALPPGPLDFCFRLRAADRLLIDRAALGFAGGKVSIAGVNLAPAQPLDTVLAVQAVDLGALLVLVGVDGLSGSGALSGNIPVHLDNSGMTIAKGRLASAGPGILRYAGAGLPADITSRDSNATDAVSLLREAIADFHYTSLILSLDRTADGQGTLLANIRGNNPAVLDGRPFALNIRFEANVDKLASILLDGYAAGGEMLRRAANP